MRIGLTYHEMRALRPCPSASRAATCKLGGKDGWNDRKVTVREAKDAGIPLRHVLWVASELAVRGDDDVARRLRLWAADCAARVVHLYERHGPNDTRVRDAITAARQYARGEIDRAARFAAHDGAVDAANTFASATVPTACFAAIAARWAASRNGALDETGTAAARAVREADPGGWDAMCAEKDWQYEQLVARMEEPEPEDWPLDTGALG